MGLATSSLCPLSQKLSIKKLSKSIFNFLKTLANIYIYIIKATKREYDNDCAPQ